MEAAAALLHLDEEGAEERVAALTLLARAASITTASAVHLHRVRRVDRHALAGTGEVASAVEHSGDDPYEPVEARDVRVAPRAPYELEEQHVPPAQEQLRVHLAQ